ncbi:heterokaryon incompatibility protein-domain-containing protein [Leptodontidium sp. 2 PMI_412]|nr:heterokaryon incompatibility protein-domain-containing protein [Leptodontidium sp. 2 PMI_412]
MSNLNPPRSPMEPKSPRRHRMETLFHRSKCSISSSSSLISTVFTSPPTGPTTKLCSRCQSIDFPALRAGTPVSHGLPSQIIAEADAGCRFCYLLYEHFDLSVERPIRLVGIRRALSLQERTALMEEGDVEGLKVVTGVDRDEDPFVHCLTFYTTHDDLAAESVLRRPFIKDFASDESFRLIKSWLDNCVYHHPGCNSPIIAQLPTRLLDVGIRGGRQDPKLFTPLFGYKDSYVALSYCWGESGANYVLRKSQLDIPNLVFDSATLPQTIRDAVEITRRLGFRFLWIDALCIIQEGDGGEDFRRESATMHEVYGNASITLAAAASRSVHGGIFQKPKYTEPPECKIPFKLSDTANGSVFVEFEDVEKGVDRIVEPLNTRAWTFQERILSPRVVLFYKDQISWDCKSKLINSNGPLNSILERSEDTPGRYTEFIASNDPSLSEVARNSKYMAYWRRSIEFYTRRNLTHQTDILKAISGLAQLIHSKTMDVYCAGMWLSDIYPHLFWHSGWVHRKSNTTIAPSWSWASNSGTIKFFFTKEYYHPSAPKTDWETTEQVEIDLQSTSDPFGDVREARLTMRGYLRVWDHSFKIKDEPLRTKLGVMFDDPQQPEEKLFLGEQE